MNGDPHIRPHRSDKQKDMKYFGVFQLKKSKNMVQYYIKSMDKRPAVHTGKRPADHFQGVFFVNMAQDRLAFIIGASRGIGYASALRLAQDGFDIAASCRGDTARLDGLRAQVEALGRSFLPISLDVTDRAEALRVVTDLFADKPPFAVVYNAGISRDDLFAWMTSAEWDDVIRTGLDGFYNCVQPLIQPLISAKKGRIIVISSASGQVGRPGQVNYSAAKAGLIGAVKALAGELGRRNILVNAVAPGVIDTEMTRDLDMTKILPLIPLGRKGAPEEVAAVVSFLAGPYSAYVTGQVIGVNGGLVC